MGTATGRGATRIAEHIANLRHEDSDVASRAQGYLVRCYGSRAVGALTAACSSPLEQERYLAAWALGLIDDPAAFETLLRLTDDPESSVRYDATWALGKLGDPRAVAPLVRILQLRDPEHARDSAAAQGLADLGEPAVPALLNALNRADVEFLGIIVRTLGRIGGESVAAALTPLLRHPDEATRVCAIEALAEIGERSGLPGAADESPGAERMTPSGYGKWLSTGMTSW